MGHVPFDHYILIFCVFQETNNVMDVNKIYLLHYLDADGIYMEKTFICPLFLLNTMEISQSFFLQYLHVPLHTKSKSTILFWLEFIFNKKLNVNMELSYYDFLTNKPIFEEI